MLSEKSSLLQQMALQFAPYHPEAGYQGERTEVTREPPRRLVQPRVSITVRQSRPERLQGEGAWRMPQYTKGQHCMTHGLQAPRHKPSPHLNSVHMTPTAHWVCAKLAPAKLMQPALSTPCERPHTRSLSVSCECAYVRRRRRCWSEEPSTSRRWRLQHLERAWRHAAQPGRACTQAVAPAASDDSCWPVSIPWRAPSEPMKRTKRQSRHAAWVPVLLLLVVCLLISGGRGCLPLCCHGWRRRPWRARACGVDLQEPYEPRPRATSLTMPQDAKSPAASNV